MSICDCVIVGYGYYISDEQLVQHQDETGRIYDKIECYKNKYGKMHQYGSKLCHNGINYCFIIFENLITNCLMTQDSIYSIKSDLEKLIKKDLNIELHEIDFIKEILEY